MSWSAKRADKKTEEQPTEPAVLLKQNSAKTPAEPKKHKGLSVHELTVFAMLGALMFCSKLLMEWAPNIHFLAMFILAFTAVYRWRAVIPLYVFVFLTGVYAGFSVWWAPYLYIWLPLYLVGCLMPRRMKPAVAVPVYMVAAALHGLSYGTLYAPAQAFFFHLNFEQTLAWIVVGFPYDVTHAIGNTAAATLVLPLSKLLNRLEKNSR